MSLASMAIDMPDMDVKTKLDALGSSWTIGY